MRAAGAATTRRRRRKNGTSAATLNRAAGRRSVVRDIPSRIDRLSRYTLAAGCGFQSKPKTPGPRPLMI